MPGVVVRFANGTGLIEAPVEGTYTECPWKYNGECLTCPLLGKCGQTGASLVNKTREEGFDGSHQG